MSAVEILNVDVDIVPRFAPTMAIRPYVSTEVLVVNWFGATVQIYHSLRILNSSGR